MRRTYQNLYGHLLIALYFLCTPFAITAQCSSAGPQNPSTFASQSFSGSNYSWSNPSNAATSNNSRATASAILSVLSGETEYLKLTGFGFNISPLASICGIQVEVEKSGSNIGVLASIQDYAVRIVKNNIVGSTNKATNADWTTTDTYSSYGGNTDTWGETWSFSDINSASFGIAFSAKIAGIVSLLPTARVDHVRVTVFYNIVLPVELLFFNAREDNGRVNLYWQTAEAQDNTLFTVQRSAEGNRWTDIGTFHSETGAVTSKAYNFTDEYPLQDAYYRIKIVPASSGQEKYSPVQKITLGRTNASFIISPNPAKSRLTITNLPDQAGEIKIYDMAGNIVLKCRHNGNRAEVDITALKTGAYIVAGGTGNSSKRTTFFKAE